MAQQMMIQLLMRTAGVYAGGPGDVLLVPPAAAAALEKAGVAVICGDAPGETLTAEQAEQSAKQEADEYTETLADETLGTGPQPGTPGTAPGTPQGAALPSAPPRMLASAARVAEAYGIDITKVASADGQRITKADVKRYLANLK